MSVNQQVQPKAARAFRTERTHHVSQIADYIRKTVESDFHEDSEGSHHIVSIDLESERMTRIVVSTRETHSFAAVRHLLVGQHSLPIVTNEKKCKDDSCRRVQHCEVELHVRDLDAGHIARASKYHTR